MAWREGTPSTMVREVEKGKGGEGSRGKNGRKEGRGEGKGGVGEDRKERGRKHESE